MNDSMAHASSSHTLHNPQPATIRNTSRNHTLQKPCDAFTQNTCSDGLTRLKVRHCYLSHCQTHALQRKITRKNWTLGQMWTNPTVGLDLVIVSIFNELILTQNECNLHRELTRYSWSPKFNAFGLRSCCTNFRRTCLSYSSMQSS